MADKTQSPGFEQYFGRIKTGDPTHMYALNAFVRKSRRVGHPGTIVFQLREGKKEKLFSSGIKSTSEEMLAEHKSATLHGIKVLYSIIETMTDSGKKFGLDDIAGKFIDMYRPDADFDADSPLIIRKGLANVGRNFKQYVKLTFTAKPRSALPFDIADEKPAGVSASRLADYMSTKIIERKREWSQSTFFNYQGATNAFCEFAATIPETTPMSLQLMRTYKDRLIKKNISEATANLYLRILRSVVYMAKEEKLVATASEDWFKGLVKGYKPAETVRKQKALPKGILNQLSIMNLESEPKLDLVRDLFMFCFYCEGMELFDALSLRKDSIRDGNIIHKKRSSGTARVICIEPEARKIINKYRKSSAKYIFPVLDSFGNIQYASIRHSLMKDLKNLGEKLNPAVPLTFSMARFSWQALSRQINMYDIISSK